jgi:tRNA A-37 threonylcarbamoyl transferase component Bud32
MKAPGAAPPRPFGKRVVELGLATPPQVVASLRLQAERAGAGIHQNLGQILVEQGVLTYQQVRDVLAEEFYAILECPSCKERYNVPRDRQGTVECPADGAVLHPAGSKDDIGVAATLRADTPVGMEFGGCRIVEMIGRGAMGAVYKAKHLGLNRYVAVKLLPEETGDSATAQRLVQEARAIARLEHPNIVQVYDIGRANGFVYMVMQLLRGETLEERLAGIGAPDLRDSLVLVRDLGQGLAAAHQKGVIHRDLKPANVIVTEDGRARITDFGLARTRGTTPAEGDAIVGTPSYMAPEQWLRGDVDGRTDLYSLGVILYQLTTGQKPFEAKTIRELMNLHVNEKPRAPRSLNPEISQGVQAILSKMLAKSPARRYKDLEEFLQDLDLAIQDKDPKALVETGRYVKCGFCETANPSGSTQCKVCGETLGSTRPLEIALRSGESKCPACGAINREKARACGGCRRPL